jgi:hypothetical protein
MFAFLSGTLLRCGSSLPEFGEEEPGEPMLLGDSGEAGRLEWIGVVGEFCGAEAGEDAEGEIEAADEDLRRESQEAGGEVEVGDEPEGLRGESWRDAVDKGFEVGLGEAVQEEVGDDEVVWAVERAGERAGLVRGEACRYVGGESVRALTEEAQHGGAGVDCLGAEVRVLPEEFGEEAAVSIADDQGSLLLEEIGEEAKAAVFEGAAQSEVFEPAIGSCDEIEAGLSWHYRSRKGRRRRGVVRARSARLRRVRRAV